MFRAIIIDDEVHGINCLKLLIEKHIPEVRIVGETTEALEGITLIENYRPEMVFLDINMPHLNGFDLLHRLKFRNFNLIFTTAHQEYAIQAIRMNAVDYLLKPIDIDDLKETVNRIKNNLITKKTSGLNELLEEAKNDSSSKIPFHTKDKIEYLNKNDILRMESESNYTHIFTTTGHRFTVSKTMGEYENLLCNKDNHFMRVHQSHIVNLNHIIRFVRENGGLIITKDHSEIPLAKTKKDDFTKWLKVR